MDLKDHLFSTCHTGSQIIIEVSKFLEDTSHIVILPPSPKETKNYCICACDSAKFGLKDPKGKFVVFIGDHYGISEVSTLHPNLDETKWSIFGDILFSNLTQLKTLFLEGRLAIHIDYNGENNEVLVTPNVEIVHISMTVDVTPSSN